jgi:Phage integrase family
MCSGSPWPGVLRRLRPAPDRSAVGAPSPTHPPAAGAPRARSRTVPVFTVVRSTKEEPDYAPAASLRVRRSLSPQPPWQLMSTTTGVPCHAHAQQVRAASSPDPPGSSWRRIKGMSHAGSSRTPLRHARRTRTIWQYWPVPALSGLLPPSPAPPGLGCPQLHRPAATGSAAKVSHLPSNHSASRRTHDLRHYYASLLISRGLDVKVVQARLRHASAKTTLDTYGHLWPDSDDSTRAAIDVVMTARVENLADYSRTRGGGCARSS